MKIKRQKKVNKNINFYVNNFGFRQPFQVLIDGTFCHTALKNKINIQEQLPKYLQAELKLLTTQCVVLETEELGSKVFGCMKIIKQFAVHKCGHEKQKVTGSQCLKSMVKQNEGHYIVATQDRDLQNHFRKIPAVPIIYLHQVAPILEQPSEATLKLAKSNADNLLGVNKVQREILTKLKERSGIAADDPATSFGKKKKKKKGVNPLSCLKKKTKPHEANKIVKTEISNIQDKAKRKRIRIPKHIKEEVVKSAK